MTNFLPSTLLRWDWIIFTATTTAFVAHMYYNNNNSHKYKKSRTSRSTKQVSFQLDDATDGVQNIGMIHRSITEMIPSIDFRLSSPKIIGLLFAAKWCPDCTDIVPSIGRILDTSRVATSKSNDDDANDWIQIIYISSDSDEESIQQFKPKNMLHIPYDAIDERTRIKQLYSTCAAKEMKTLQIITRKHGIPALILLNAQTGAILAENAIDDVINPNNSEQQILDRWKQLLV
jgi:Thioredoxin-like